MTKNTAEKPAKKRMSKTKLFGLSVLVFMFFLLLVNKFCNQIPYYIFKVTKLGEIGFNEKVLKSPDGKYTVYIVECGFNGEYRIVVGVTRWYSLFPKNIIFTGVLYGTGQTADVFLSKNGRYAALYDRGLLIDLYDFETNKGLASSHESKTFQGMSMERHLYIKSVLGEGAVSLRGITNIEELAPSR